MFWKCAVVVFGCLTSASKKLTVDSGVPPAPFYSGLEERVSCRCQTEHETLQFSLQLVNSFIHIKYWVFFFPRIENTCRLLLRFVQRRGDVVRWANISWTGGVWVWRDGWRISYPTIRWCCYYISLVISFLYYFRQFFSYSLSNKFVMSFPIVDTSSD